MERDVANPLAGLPPLIHWESSVCLSDPGEDAYYRQTLRQDPPTAAKLEAWAERNGFRALLRVLESWGLMPHGEVCELGAGHCWFSAVLSLRPEVTSIWAVDACEAMIDEGALATLRWLGCRPEKIRRVVGDFHSLKLPDGAVDWVVFDASLHHATDPQLAMSEAFRVLRSGGRALAIRERVLPRWSRRDPFDNALDRELRQYGEFEHVHSASAYQGFFSEAGFEVQARQYFRAQRVRGIALPGWVCALPPLRWRLGQYVFWGSKP